MSASPLPRGGRPPGQRYILMPSSRGVRAWFVGSDGQVESGPTAFKERTLRNLMTRRGMVEVTLTDICGMSVRDVPPEGRL